MTQSALDALVHRLTRQDMPIFAQSMKNIQGLSERRDSSLSELAHVVLQDAALTARMLKLANSVHFNKGFRRINTISRAVVMLGYDTVRSLCLSISLIETLLNGSLRDQVVREMATAFHSAAQARKLISRFNEKYTEEVFIAALLYRIGPIAFWCFGRDLANRLEDALKLDAGTPPARIEQEVLGFRLQQLTVRLSKEWHLSDLLDAALERKDTADIRVRAVDLGYRIAHNVQHGWDTPEAAAVIRNVAEFLNLPEAEVVPLLHETAHEAFEIAASYGMAASSRLIPLPREAGLVPSGTTSPDEFSPESESPVSSPAFPIPDPVLQFNVLRDLSTLMQDTRIDVNLLFSVLLEGIYRGIGMDRVLFAVLTPDRASLRGKSGLGWDSREEVLRLSLSAQPKNGNLFGHVLRTQKPLWIKHTVPPDLSPLMKPEVLALSGNSPFFLMPILAKGQSIGVVYADRTPSRRELDEESFSSFCFFCHQAGLCLSYISR